MSTKSLNQSKSSKISSSVIESNYGTEELLGNQEMRERNWGNESS